MSRPLHVLIVEDCEADAELLVYELERGGYKPIYQRVDTREAMQAALNKRVWDAILADYSMPRFDPNAALELLQSRGLDIPFIIVSGIIGEEAAVKAMKAGAHDYLLKDNLTRLVPAIERELREALLREERRQALEKLQHQAFYDNLTGLPNRALFLQQLQEHMAKQLENGNFAVLFLRLDRYQVVKYSMGHSLGDRLLVATVQRLHTCLRPQDILAKVGEAEFAVLLQDLPAPNRAEAIADRLHRALATPFQLDGPVVFSTASVGIADSTIERNSPEEYLQAADTAMHYAQMRGVGCTALFDTAMWDSATNLLQLETDLQQAIERCQMYLQYQPIVSLINGDIVGFEALARWQHPQRGLVSPGEFIPVAEASGLIVPLGYWVLEEAMRRVKVWQELFPGHKPLSISVNISGIQLSQPDLLDTIDRICTSSGLKGNSLRLEITESVLLDNPAATIHVLEQLQQRQVQICIDDFGTGYSSLSYLHFLPIDVLKIDRSFITRLEKGGKNVDIVRAIVTLAYSLGLEVIAEGVETPEQLAFLQKLGCPYGQGHLFHPAVDPEAAIALLASPNCNKISGWLDG